MAGKGISAAVGAGGANRYADVITVQKLINKTRELMDSNRIGVDGAVGGETIGAITALQRVFFGWSDGRVDPNGQTLKALNLVEQHLQDPGEVFKRGPYSMRMDKNGRIFVNPNDWLSKYSAILHNDFWHVHEFARLTDEGLERITDINRIYATETIYHIPTYEKANQLFMGEIPEILPPISKEKRKKITKDFLDNEFKLKGKYMPDWLDTALDATDAADTLAGIVTLIIKSAAAEAIATVLEVIGPFLFAVENTVNWAEVSDTDVRMYGMLAVAYTTAGWAFDQPQPTESRKILGNWRAHGTYPPAKLERAAKFWQEAANATRANLEAYPAKQGVHKNSWKLTLRSIGGGSPRVLAVEILKGFEADWKKHPPAVLRVWQSFYDLKFPE